MRHMAWCSRLEGRSGHRGRYNAPLRRRHQQDLQVLKTLTSKRESFACRLLGKIGVPQHSPLPARSNNIKFLPVPIGTRKDALAVGSVEVANLLMSVRPLMERRRGMPLPHSRIRSTVRSLVCPQKCFEKRYDTIGVATCDRIVQELLSAAPGKRILR